MDAVTVILRPYTPDDAPFLFSTWRNSSFYGMAQSQSQVKRFEAVGMPKEWFREKTRQIRHVLGLSTVTMAVLSDDPTQLVGYSVVEGKHLHWVYVKADYRNAGVASLLVPRWVDMVTSDLTKIGKAIVAAKGLKTKGEEDVRSGSDDQEG